MLIRRLIGPIRVNCKGRVCTGIHYAMLHANVDDPTPATVAVKTDKTIAYILDG